MQLSLRNFTTLVEQSAAAVQASAAQLLDFTPGSVLRAILEANAGLGLWMQWLILQVLQSTRLATSSGADADSFGADFGFSRLPAVAATGDATFSRFTPGQSALVPSGTRIATADGATDFIVTADAQHAAWNATLDGYQLGAGLASVTVPVLAVAPGSGGNLLPGTISLITSTLPGIDAVTNATATSGGLDAESDASFRSRFQSFIDSRSRATVQAVRYAVTSLRQGISCSLQENTDGAGAFAPGRFLVTLDDGSGAPPSALITAAQAAVDMVRPIGSIFTVQPPSQVSADISMNLDLVPGSDAAGTIAAVNAAVSGFVNTLPVGSPLPYTRLAQLAYDASPAVRNVSGLTLCGGIADLAAGPGAVIKLGTLAIS
ncbi:baseplate J/gp47 family protein [Acidisoma sp. 7E03]